MNSDPVPKYFAIFMSIFIIVVLFGKCSSDFRDIELAKINNEMRKKV